MIDQPKRILIVRFKAIGDCVMVAWPVTALRNAYPESLIVWAVETQCSPVIDRRHLAQRVVQFPRHRWKANKFKPSTTLHQLGTYLRLRKYNFDLGIDFHGHSKSALALRISGAATKLIIEPKDMLAKALGPSIPGPKEPMHRVDQFMDGVRHLNPNLVLPEFPIMPEELHLPEELIGRKYVSLMTGSSLVRKLLPVSVWKETAIRLKERGIEPVIVGGPKDPDIQAAGIRSYVGKLSLRSTMAVVKHSVLHAAGDTGTGHIAAAFGIPTVTVSPDSADFLKMYRPFSDCSTVVRCENGIQSANADEIFEAVCSQFERSLV